jgi:alpha-ketoglutarate-dependent taurine dioxygenase
LYPDSHSGRLAAALSAKWEIDAVAERCAITLAARGARGLDFVSELCTKERTQIIELVEQHGAVVLRGFDIRTPADHEALMVDCLGLSVIFTDHYLRRSAQVLSAADRSRRSETTLDLPADSTLQGPHVENGWRSRRPRYVSFWCETPAAEHGETALFDLSESFAKLSPEIRAYFERYPSVYAASGERYAINSTLIHPSTGKECLVLWYFESPLSDHAVAAYEKTSHHRDAPRAVSPHKAINFPLRHVFRTESGEISLSEAQAAELMDCLYDNADYLRWQAGDVLLMDNIRLAHGRMPSSSPRRLVAGYWNEEDMRQFSRHPEVADDCPASMEAGRSPDYMRRVMRDLVAGRLKM